MTIGCIVFNAVVGSLPSVFMQKVIALVEQSWQDGAWNAVGGQILRLVGLLAVFYLLSLAAGLAFNQLMAIITQGALKNFGSRCSAACSGCPSAISTPTTMATS